MIGESLNRLLLIAAFASISIFSTAQTAKQNSELQVTAPSASNQIKALVRDKRWQDVITLTVQLEKTDAKNPDLFYWRGVSHLQLHEPVPAVQAFRVAEKLGLNNAPFHEGLGLAYYDLNQFVLFEEQMKKATALDPQDAKPDYYLGLYRLTIRSDIAGALPLFESASKLDANDWKSLYQSGNCLEQLGRLEEAAARYKQAIGLLDKNSTQFGWPYQGMARILMESDLQSALEFARKAVEREPEEPANHLILANILEQVGNLPEAVHEAEIAAEKNPNDSKTLYTLYKLYRRTENPKAAAQLKQFEQTRTLYDAN